MYSCLVPESDQDDAAHPDQIFFFGRFFSAHFLTKKIMIETGTKAMQNHQK
jgi:hypothetical protein